MSPGLRFPRAAMRFYFVIVFMNKKKTFIYFLVRYQNDQIVRWRFILFLQIKNAISKMIETGFKLRRRNRIDMIRLIDGSSRPMLTKCQFNSLPTANRSAE